MTLDEWLEKAKNRTPGEFKPYACYNETGDMIQVYLEDTPCNWSQATPYASIAYADDDGRVVAFEIAAPKKIIEDGMLGLLGSGVFTRQRPGFTG